MQDQNPCFRIPMKAMAAIGLIHTPFEHCKGTPIQSAVAAGAQGIVEVFPEFIAGLRDVADFERLWLITLLDRATAPQMIVRPYLDNEEHGIFATRSPARPNHIGISVVRLLGVEENRLLVADVDMSASANDALGNAHTGPDGVAVQVPGRPDAPEFAGRLQPDEPELDLPRPAWNGAQAGF